MIEFLASLEIVERIINTVKTLMDIFEKKQKCNPAKRSHKKITVPVACVTLLLVVGCVAYSAHHVSTKDSYPGFEIDDGSENSDEGKSTSGYMDSLDVDYFYEKYYEDPLTSVYPLPLMDASMDEVILDFIELNTVEFSENKSLEDADDEALNLLEKASKLEKKYGPACPDVGDIRIDVYEICHNMIVAKHSYDEELEFSYYEVSNSLGVTYYKLFVLSKAYVDGEYAEYLYRQACSSYKVALSDISQISAKDEEQYRKNLEFMHTVYKDYVNQQAIAKL